VTTTLTSYAQAGPIPTAVDVVPLSGRVGSRRNGRIEVRIRTKMPRGYLAKMNRAAGIELLTLGLCDNDRHPKGPRCVAARSRESAIERDGEAGSSSIWIGH
jgi:hypothetical protein